MDDSLQTRRSNCSDSDRDTSTYRRRMLHQNSRQESVSPAREQERSERHRDDSGERNHDERSRRRRDHGNDEDRRRRHHRRDRSRDDHRSDSGRERRHRDRFRSRSRERSYQDMRSRSPAPKRRRSRNSSPARKPRAPLPSQDESFRGDLAPGEKPPEKQRPNFKPTGLLAKEANTVAGTTTVLKYHEPAEARKPPPKEQWRLYVFKGKDLLDTIHLHQRSAWLIGRDQKVTDLFLEHPSISKQHAVIQFRYITTTNQYGDKLSKVKPYLIDLESKKGTRLNGKQIEVSRFVELVDQDVLSFADSEREYVLMLPSADK